jgi:hypothetical protein
MRTKLNLTFGLFVFIFCLSFISASWGLPKYTTCDLIGINGTQCDVYWCNVIDCAYNTTLETCLCTQVIMNYTNITVQEEENIPQTPEELEDWFQDRLDEYLNNDTNDSEILNSNYATKDDLLNITVTLRNDLLDAQQEMKTETITLSNARTTQDPPKELWILLGFGLLILAGLGGFGIYVKSKENKTKEVMDLTNLEENFNRPIHNGVKAEEQLKQETKKNLK